MRLSGQGLSSHTATTTISRFFEKNRGRALSTGWLGLSLAEFLLPVLIVFILTFVDWWDIWVSISILVIIILPIASYFLVKEVKLDTREESKKEAITKEIKQEIDKNTITNDANFKIFTSSIFFPIQTKTMLLSKVAEAYIEPNCPWVIDKASLILELKRPRKKLCPKLEKNVKIKPNIITFKLKLLNIDKNYDF